MQEDLNNKIESEDFNSGSNGNGNQNNRVNGDDAIISYTHQIPLLPEWANEKKRYVDTAGGEYYLNAYKLECNCPEYSHKSHKFKYRDIRKLCLHLYHTLQEEKYQEQLDDLTKLLIDAIFKYRVKKFYKTSVDDKDLIIGIKRLEDWVNIYINEGTWKNYNYHPAEKVWEYNFKPDNDEKVQFWIEAIRLYAKLDFQRKK